MENTKELYEAPAAEYIMFDANDCFLTTSTGDGGGGDGGDGGD